MDVPNLKIKLIMMLNESNFELSVEAISKMDLDVHLANLRAK
jgi:hypothetical protein